MNVLRIVRRKKINIFLIIILLIIGISSTYAWFHSDENNQTSGLVTKVSSWGVEFIMEDEEILTNRFTIEIPEFYPGMEDIEKKIDIYNLGEEMTTLEYEIESIQIFGEEVLNNETLENETEEITGIRAANLFGNSSATLFDPDNTNYSFYVNYPTPFEIKYSYNKLELAGLGGDGEYSGWFKINFSWLNNQLNNEEDTKIGNLAYDYMKSQENNENKESPIKIVVKITGRKTNNTQQ